MLMVVVKMLSHPAPLESVKNDPYVKSTQLFVKRNVEDLGLGKNVPFQANAGTRELNAS